MLLTEIVNINYSNFYPTLQQYYGSDENGPNTTVCPTLYLTFYRSGIRYGKSAASIISRFNKSTIILL